MTNKQMWVGTLRPEELDLTDGEIRERFNIPEGRYYSVTDEGRVILDLKRVRVLRSRKLSKSHQQNQ
jgi:hypothetical protein